MPSSLTLYLIDNHFPATMQRPHLRSSIVWVCENLKSKIDLAYDLIHRLPPKATAPSTLYQARHQALTVTMGSLPNELKLAICREIADVPSLYAFSLSSKSNYELYAHNETGVLPKVFSNATGPCLFQEAYWTMRASRLNYTISNRRVKANQLLTEWLDSEEPPVQPSDLSLEDMHELAKFHKLVHRLVTDFFEYTWARAPLSKSSKTPHQPLTRTEFERIARGFYRFEFFRNLFQLPDVDDTCPIEADKSRSFRANAYRFFSNYQAWEVEEIACIRDYIHGRLQRIFSEVQDVAAKDPPHWIEYSLSGGEPTDLPTGFRTICEEFKPSHFNSDFDYGADLSPEGILHFEFIEDYMSRGLHHLSRFVTAADATERSEIFSQTFDPTQYPSNWYDFLTQALYEDLEDRFDDEDDEGAFVHSDPQLFEGEESGPNKGWVWSNDGKFEMRYGKFATIDLRRWGYVMWDEQRLSQAGIIDRPWNVYVEMDEIHEQEEAPRMPDNHKDICRRRGSLHGASEALEGQTPDTAETAGPTYSQSPDNDFAELSDDEEVDWEDVHLSKSCVGVNTKARVALSEAPDALDESNRIDKLQDVGKEEDDEVIELMLSPSLPEHFISELTVLDENAITVKLSIGETSDCSGASLVQSQQLNTPVKTPTASSSLCDERQLYTIQEEDSSGDLSTVNAEDSSDDESIRIITSPTLEAERDLGESLEALEDAAVPLDHWSDREGSPPFELGQVSMRRQIKKPVSRLTVQPCPPGGEIDPLLSVTDGCPLSLLPSSIVEELPASTRKIAKPKSQMNRIRRFSTGGSICSNSSIGSFDSQKPTPPTSDEGDSPKSKSAGVNFADLPSTVTFSSGYKEAQSPPPSPTLPTRTYAHTLNSSEIKLLTDGLDAAEKAKANAEAQKAHKYAKKKAWRKRKMAKKAEATAASEAASYSALTEATTTLPHPPSQDVVAEDDTDKKAAPPSGSSSALTEATASPQGVADDDTEKKAGGSTDSALTDVIVTRTITDDDTKLDDAVAALCAGFPGGNEQDAVERGKATLKKKKNRGRGRGKKNNDRANQEDY